MIGTKHYAYDAADQAIYHFDGNWGLVAYFGYDPVGNRLYNGYENSDNWDGYTTNALNQYTDILERNPVAYDNRGKGVSQQILTERNNDRES